AQALTERGSAVVQAPPGSGKTTLVPPAVALAVAGRVVVTQPRRIAARAAAARLAHLLGEPLGQTVGYAVRGDRRGGAATQVEFVTTGVLLRRLQRDPELPGIGAVVLDEVHERQLDADLTLALLVDVRRHLREDLPLVAMSATVEAERTAALIGGPRPATVVTVPGSLHPVDVRWAPPPPGVRPTDDRGVTPGFLDHVAATVRRALAATDGDVLAFLPGAREVDQVVRRLQGEPDVDVRALHGRLTGADQDRALTPGPRRRVVVSTAVAESSLTVPGVRAVVDAGLSREPRTDHRRGLAGLVTVRVSRASAEQRAGRAGRQGPGVVHRCWTESEHPHLLAHPLPEIATADLTSFALESAVWGAPRGEGLALLDPPPPAALDAAIGTLIDLDAVAHDGAVTERGRAIARLATDPRLARALLAGAAVVGAQRAAEVVALLGEDVRAPGADLVAALRAMRAGGRAGESGAWAAAVRRLRGSLPDDLRDHRGESGLGDDLAVGTVVALAHPDRIARRRPGSQAYLMVSGTGAVLPRGVDPGALTDWIAIGDVERTSGARDALVRSAAPLDESLALDAATSRWQESDEVRWAEGRIVARRVTRLGAVELSSAVLGDPDPLLVGAALRDGLARDGLDVLRWSDAAQQLRHRMAFLHRSLGEPWPDVSDDGLLAGIDTWLGDDLARVRSTRDLARVDVLTGLRRLLPWPEAGRIDELAPPRLTVPSGSVVRIDYAPEQPVLAVRVQEMYGAEVTPRLADGRVPVLLHLLSPAGRPAAVTADLASFWTTGYPGVRADLRGRYPKHSWPEDPATAPPLRGTKKRG
ncbi:MAG: ATP-dependent helicase HrpB, partial [Nocardioides sp.]|uniref:ATP-dependent helicase HrpB n=1 Tax=Nocardioides sp. TaxID=35761 RepID=UPI0023A66C96